MSNLMGILTAVSTCLAPFPVTVPKVPEPVHTVTYQLVTNEIKSKLPSGQEQEVYRFDPGVVVVEEGDDVVLKLYGLKGHDHPVQLEGYDVKTVIQKNKASTLTFKADRPGVYKLWCTSHPDVAHGGPMEGYVVVVPQKR